MRWAVGVLAALLILATETAQADLIGHYKVSGVGPDGSSYSGDVAVEMTGNTFHVVRVIGRQRYVGTGLGDKNVLAVTYHTGNGTLLALYVQDDTGRWVGTWTYADGTRIGSEYWRPHVPH